jgi:hypothetical protein
MASLTVVENVLTIILLTTTIIIIIIIIIVMEAQIQRNLQVLQITST